MTEFGRDKNVDICGHHIWKCPLSVTHSLSQSVGHCLGPASNSIPTLRREDGRLEEGAMTASGGGDDVGGGPGGRTGKRGRGRAAASTGADRER